MNPLAMSNNITDMDSDENPTKRVKLMRNTEESMIDGFDEELWEVCPLDSSHYFKKKDSQEHIFQCKKHFLKSPRRVECPFNPLHIINLMEIEHHILTCKNRVTLLNSLCDFDAKRPTIEGVKMEPMNVAIEIPTYWEDDEHPERGYNGMESTNFRTVIRPMPTGLSKAQKRKWKEQERQRWKWLAGETKEKPQPAPNSYPKIASPDRDVARFNQNSEATTIDEANIMQAIVDGLSSANIADPRDAVLKRINARLKVLALMEIKVREEKIALQRQVEEYVSNVGKNAKPPSDPRRLSVPRVDINVDPRTANRDRTLEILPDILRNDQFNYIQENL